MVHPIHSHDKRCNTPRYRTSDNGLCQSLFAGLIDLRNDIFILCRFQVEQQFRLLHSFKNRQPIASAIGCVLLMSSTFPCDDLVINTLLDKQAHTLTPCCNANACKPPAKPCPTALNFQSLPLRYNSPNIIAVSVE